MKNIKKVETYLPLFTGFYNSIFEPRCRLEDDIENCSDDELKEYYGYLEVDLDWLKENYLYYVNNDLMSNEVAECISDAFMELDYLDIIQDVTYDKLVSPEFYNFSTDSINCTIEADFDKIAAYLNKNLDAFKDDRDNRYTSCDGFSSNYPIDLDYWLDPENWDAHGLGSVLDFIFKNESRDAVIDLYYASNMSEAINNCDWLDEKALKAAYKKHLTKTKAV